VKEPSAPSVFKLLCVDAFETPEPVRNIAADPRNRVYQAHQRGETTWVFVISFLASHLSFIHLAHGCDVMTQVPGPPNLNFVVYLEGNKVICLSTNIGIVMLTFDNSGCH
jgi:hypothetical protein